MFLVSFYSGLCRNCTRHLTGGWEVEPEGTREKILGGGQRLFDITTFPGSRFQPERAFQRFMLCMKVIRSTIRSPLKPVGSGGSGFEALIAATAD